MFVSILQMRKLGLTDVTLALVKELVGPPLAWCLVSGKTGRK